MKEEKQTLDIIVERMLPKALRPHAPAIFATFAIIGILILFAWAYGLDSLLILLLFNAIIFLVIILWMLIQHFVIGKFKNR